MKSFTRFFNSFPVITELPLGDVMPRIPRFKTRNRYNVHSAFSSERYSKCARVLNLCYMYLERVRKKSLTAAVIPHAV